MRRIRATQFAPPHRPQDDAARMTPSVHVRVQARRLAVVMLVTCPVTPIFNVTTSEASVRSAVQGVVDAPLITPLVGGYLLFIRNGRYRIWLRRPGFWADLILSSAIVLALFLPGRATGQVVTSQEPVRFLQIFGERHLVYALPFFALLAIAVQFVLQTNRMIGADVLRYFVTGVYHRPGAGERIFLFLDLEGSTGLAERPGSARYFELLRRFADDLTEPVLETRGQSHQ